MYLDLDQLQQMAADSSKKDKAANSPEATGQDGAAWINGASREAIYLLLIRQTLDLCQKHVPYYRNTWKTEGLTPDLFERLDDLGKFPALSKDVIVEQKNDFLNEIEPRTSIRDTSGTTGKRLTVYGNDQEVAAQRALLKIRTASQNRDSQKTGILRVLPPMKRSLALPGFTMGEDTAQVVAFVTAYEKSRFDSYDNILDIIFQDYHLSEQPFPLSILHVTPPFIMDGIVEALERRGADMRRSPIRKVILTGNFVFDAQRKRIADLWDAETITSFSCTEVIGEARECSLDRSIHHIGPTMYAEVVHPDTMKAVPVGQQGVLLLTSLFPFQRVMPLIRYATGDVARNLGYGCACGDPGLKIRLSGRAKHCVKLISEEGENQYFGTREIGEAVYAHKALSQFPFPRFCATTGTVDGREEICLHVEAVNLEAFDQEGVGNAMRTSLINDCPELDRAMQNGDFKVKYYQRGGLSDHWKIYPER